jgi:hypothetical protein
MNFDEQDFRIRQVSDDTGPGYPELRLAGMERDS